MAQSKSFNTRELLPKAIVVVINTELKENNKDNIIELSGLCEADNLEVVGFLTQNIVVPNSATLIGKGKLDQLKEMVEEEEADIVVFDNELSGAKIKNLEAALGVQVATRSMIILDIFASRAETNEGKKQTELAQLKYMLPRLVGSYVGGGKYKGGAGGSGNGGASVGMRGPGETKLELDKRNIKDKIAKLEAEIKQLEKARDLSSKKREEGATNLVSLVGYTNAGKSTIMNALSKANVLSKDMLFATLDTVSRNVWIDPQTQIILSDTVGFINRLPHEFIVAFRSTLKAATKAKLLLVVVDSSSRLARKELNVVLDVLDSIGAGKIKKIIVLNKTDRIYDEAILKQIENEFENTIRISAKTGEGLDALKLEIKRQLQ